MMDDKAKKELQTELIKRVNKRERAIMRSWLGIMVGTSEQNYRGTQSRPNVRIVRIVSNVFSMFYKPIHRD